MKPVAGKFHPNLYPEVLDHFLADNLSIRSCKLQFESSRRGLIGRLCRFDVVASSFFVPAAKETLFFRRMVGLSVGFESTF